MEDLESPKNFFFFSVLCTAVEKVIRRKGLCTRVIGGKRWNNKVKI